MFRKSELSLAISAAIASSAAGLAPAAEIEEVIVTATKRAESSQDIPIALQALGGDSLKELRAETFDKYIDFLPNVVSAGNGPGQKEIHIRGSATEQTSVTVSSAQGSAPGVALYLDEHPVSFGGRNLDVYSADIQRVEVLSGPQGTLFGASSQSGALRMITNKPVHGTFEAGFNAKYSGTKGGAKDAIKNGYVDLSDLQSDGSVNETDIVLKATLNWQAADDVLFFASYADGYRPAAQNRNAGSCQPTRKAFSKTTWCRRWRSRTP